MLIFDSEIFINLLMIILEISSILLLEVYSFIIIGFIFIVELVWILVILDVIVI